MLHGVSISRARGATQSRRRGTYTRPTRLPTRSLMLHLSVRVSAFQWLAWAAASLLAGATAVFVAAHHPLGPWIVSLTLVAWTVAAYVSPSAWLFVLPASLPALNLSPWTGWI